MNEYLTIWDVVLLMMEFAYNSSVNKSTALSPFEIVSGYNPRKPINLLPTSISHRSSISIESFA